MTTRLAIFALCCAASLTGCDTLTVRSVGGPTTLYKVNDLNFAGSGRDFRVVVWDDGATLGGHEALQQAIIRELQANTQVRTRFTATPQTHNRDFKVVVVANPAINVPADALCREPSEKPALRVQNAPGTLHVMGAFCRGDDVLTEIDVFASGVEATNSGRFKALMTALSRGLFPTRDLRLDATPE